MLVVLEEALSQCREMIRVGSKSFAMASRLFDSDTRDAAFFLYGWCRYCDDQIDQACSDSVESRLGALIDATRSAFRGEGELSPVFVALQHVMRTYSIPSDYPLELLEGMAMDARGERYETFQDLTLYCYRVAGTVGLMMTHIMGVNDERALQHAVDLGMAMQLTNIARDVLEDAQIGRVYLPLDWLREAGIAASGPELAHQVADPNRRAGVAVIVGRLLERADSYYRSGDQGFVFLPIRSAFAVAAARAVYSEIGRRVVERGPSAWDTRTVVSAWGKARTIVLASLVILKLIPSRVFKPWSAVSISAVWRLP